MNTDATTDTKMAPASRTARQQEQETATVTLRAGDTSMRILALRRRDGSATTTVTVIGADKKTSRGMTKVHADFATAQTHLAKLVAEATGKGWTRRHGGGFTPRPDAFSALPAPPTAAPSEQRKRAKK
jgi:hypothetical protein